MAGTGTVPDHRHCGSDRASPHRPGILAAISEIDSKTGRIYHSANAQRGEPDKENTDAAGKESVRDDPHQL